MLKISGQAFTILNKAFHIVQKKTKNMKSLKREVMRPEKNEFLSFSFKDLKQNTMKKSVFKQPRNVTCAQGLCIFCLILQLILNDLTPSVHSFSHKIQKDNNPHVSWLDCVLLIIFYYWSFTRGWYPKQKKTFAYSEFYTQVWINLNCTFSNWPH